MIFIFNYIFVFVYGHGKIHLSAGGYRGQMLDPLELQTVVRHTACVLGIMDPIELLTIVRHTAWVLGIMHRFSARAFVLFNTEPCPYLKRFIFILIFEIII